MKRPYFSPSSRLDLQQIMEFIALDKPGAALNFVERLEEACRALAKNPDLGASRDDLLPRLRVWSVGKYAIFYRQTEDGIDVVRVVHGAKNFTALFQ
jgi:toxin ParE1/3/4